MPLNSDLDVCLYKKKNSKWDGICMYIFWLLKVSSRLTVNSLKVTCLIYGPHARRQHQWGPPSLKTVWYKSTRGTHNEPISDLLLTSNRGRPTQMEPRAYHKVQCNNNKPEETTIQSILCVFVFVIIGVVRKSS